MSNQNVNNAHFNNKMFGKLKQFLEKYVVRPDPDVEEFLFDDKFCGWESIEVWEKYQEQTALFCDWNEIKDEIVFNGGLLLIRTPFIPDNLDYYVYNQMYIEKAKKMTVSELLIHCSQVLSYRDHKITLKYRSLNSIKVLKNDVPTIEIK